MRGTSHPRRREDRYIEAVVRSAAAGRQCVLAVSGGRDSMALMHAFARSAAESVVMVATFDHGTGAAASDAAGLVASEAAAFGFPVVVGHAAATGTSEEEWRRERRLFLSEVVGRTGGVVATAHTRDDQVETILMRVMRDTGARGLAGLYAASDTLRPLLDSTRDEVADYAYETGVKWVEDPTNASMRFFRNRVRHDLLPALTRANPDFEDQLIGLAREAGRWRADLDALVEPLAQVSPTGRSVRVAVGDLSPYSRAELSSVWPAIAARIGLAMDWRGTERAAAFTNESRTGARIQLSGGWEIMRSRDQFELRRWRQP